MMELIAFGLVWGVTVSFLALALGTTWRILGILDFGLAGVYAVVAYALYTFHVELGMPIWLAVPLSVAVGPVLQVAIYAIAYRPFLIQRRPLATLVLISLAVLYICENALSLIYTSSGRMVLTSVPMRLEVASVSLTIIDIANVAVLMVIVIGLQLMFRFSDLGLSLRATATNPELARIFAVSPERVRITVLGLAGGLTSISSVLLSLYEPITPSGGFNPLLFAFAAIVVASTKSGIGIGAHVLAGLGLGLLAGISLIVIPSQWQLAVPFAAMLVFSLVRRSVSTQRTV